MWLNITLVTITDISPDADWKKVETGLCGFTWGVLADTGDAVSCVRDEHGSMFSERGGGIEERVAQRLWRRKENSMGGKKNKNKTTCQIVRIYLSTHHTLRQQKMMNHDPVIIWIIILFLLHLSVWHCDVNTGAGLCRQLNKTNGLPIVIYTEIQKNIKYKRKQQVWHQSNIKLGYELQHYVQREETCNDDSHQESAWLCALLPW